MAPIVPQPGNRPAAPQQAARPQGPHVPGNPQRANANQPQQPRPAQPQQPAQQRPAQQPATAPRPAPQPQPGVSQTFAPSVTLDTAQPAGQLAASGVDAEEIARQKRNAASKAARIKRLESQVDYPGLTYTDEAGNTTRVLLESVPSDFNPETHKPLKSSDFKHRAVYLEFRAAQCELQAAEYRKQAEIARTQPAAPRGAGKKIATMQSTIDVLRSQLEAAGIDVNAALRAAGLLPPEGQEALADGQPVATEQPQTV